MYHLNLTTGEPGVCKAKPGNCPLAAAGDHFDTLIDARKVYEDRMREASVPAPVTGSKTSSKFSNLLDHTDMKTIVPEVMKDGPARNKGRERWYGLYCGNMNPTTGDGDDYGHWGNGDSIILGKANGSRARVIVSGGSFVQNPENQLGLPVDLTKQQHNSKDTETPDLYVLGVITADGVKHGWVPNKKIGYFVFK